MDALTTATSITNIKPDTVPKALSSTFSIANITPYPTAIFDALLIACSVLCLAFDELAFGGVLSSGMASLELPPSPTRAVTPVPATSSRQVAIVGALRQD